MHPDDLCPDCGERHATGSGACTERTRTRSSETTLVLPGFRILGPLGAGAMGTVYLAEDSTLHRQVAVKIVAPALVADADARQRFLREARAMASVQHPNVVRIYSFGEYEGTGYIVMELIEGESLREYLHRRKNLEVEDALRIVRSVVLALEAAWAKGIVHRDIKPSNILLDREGEVHVADFGLARPVATGETAITAQGALVGTPDYVSPEQAKGESVDCRSDMYSLGIVLYEMLAGSKPFTAPTPVAVVARHIHEPLPSLRSSRPAPVVDVVESMTSKDPIRRPTSYAALREEIENLLATGEAAKVTRWRAMTWVSVGALAVLAFLLVLLPRFFDRSSEAPTPVQVEKLTSRGTVRDGTLSPDGRFLAYVTEDSALWLKDLREKTEVRLVEGLEGETNWSELDGFSADGSYIYYFNYPPMRRDVQLFRIPLIGGTPQHVADGDSLVLSPNRSKVAAQTNEGVVVLEADGTRRTPISEAKFSVIGWFPDEEGLLLFQSGKFFKRSLTSDEEVKIGEVSGFTPGNAVSFHPDGQTVAVAAGSEGEGNSLLYALDTREGTVRPIGEKRWDRIDSVEWLPDGKGLVLNGADRDDRLTQVWLVTHPDGARRTIPGDSSEYQRVRVAADGKTALARQTLSRSQILVSMDANLSEFKRLLTGTDVEYSLCWTRSGEIIFSSNEASTEEFLYDLYVLNPETEARRRLTHDPVGSEVDPAVSPDGRYVVFTGQREAESSIFRVNTDGTGLRRLATASVPRRLWMRPQVSPDSRSVMYMDEVNAFDSTWPVLRRVSIDGGEVIPVIGPHEPGVSEDYWRFAFAGGWSNAGNQIALLHMTAHDTVSNPLELAVASLDGAITRAFPYTPESFALTWDHQRVQWSAEGPDEFLYFSRGGQLWKQPVAGGPATQVTNLDEPLFDFDWSPDGHRLVVSLWTTLSDVVRLTGFP